ncbi:MAG: hypothetical protein D6732_08010 [Methanobacteriota archaeon]|nr:MAG: hypothetical protein D6732_08010 [Euryarchaeota archaeon]
MESLPSKQDAFWAAANSLLLTLKPRTRQRYVYAYNRFFTWLGDIENIYRFKYSDANRYVKYLEESRGMNGTGKTSETVRAEVGALKSLFQTLVRDGLISANPWYGVRIKPGRRKKIHMALSDEQVARMLDIAPTTPTETQELAILSVLLGAGRRVSEVSALNCGDLGVRGLMMFKNTKTGDNLCYLPTWATKNVERWLAIRNGKKHDPMFIQYANPKLNRRLSHQGIRGIWKRACKRAGVSGVSPHSARVTVVTKLLRSGVPIDRVGLITGHKTVRSVQLYKRVVSLIDESPHDVLVYKSQG